MQLMVTQGTTFEPYDSTDVTPTQLAHFYRSLHGNYDPLFLSTPPASIAFIYKNLGCLHSLQPIPSAAAENRFSEPLVPALKIEGWIMWQTIQLLLGPEEHSEFLREAVQKWDVKDPDTGDVMPKILPRSCFPSVPDPHMVAWYEGVSERLRREADEEQSMRITAVEHEPHHQLESADKQYHRRHDARECSPIVTDDEASDSRRSALAYFKNPLFRTVDGRPGVVRRASRHPASLRGGSLMQRGKSAASSVGHVVKNIGSPHLWDGHSSSTKDRERRRRSLPHSHHLAEADMDSDEDLPSERLHPRHAALQSRRSSQNPSPASDRSSWEDDDLSPRHTPVERHHHHRRPDSRERSIRHSKSHEPASSPREYFPPYESYDRSSRRGSAQPEAQSPANTTPLQNEGVLGHGFGPSASPLFATTVARSDRPRQYQQQSGAVQRRNQHRSSERSPVGRASGRDEVAPVRRSDDRQRHQRPKVTRFETPVGGVHGRKYPNESTWR